MKTYGIFELAIVVADAQRSADFYVDVVGFEYASFDGGPGKGSRALLIGDSQYLGIWEPGVWNSTYWEGPFGHYFGDQMTEEALSTHVRTVAEASTIPLLLYNVPKFTGLTLPPQLVGQLAKGDSKGLLLTTTQHFDCRCVTHRRLSDQGRKVT